MYVQINVSDMSKSENRVYLAQMHTVDLNFETLLLPIGAQKLPILILMVVLAKYNQKNSLINLSLQ